MSRIRIKMVAIGASRQVCLLSMVVLLAVGVCFGKLAVSVSPASGPPTSKLLVSGNGFKANAEIDIYFDTKDEAKVIANSSGSFSKIAIEAPASALPGKHFVSAVQRSGETGTHAPFLINTSWSEFRFSLNHKGTNPYENVLSAETVGSMDVLWTHASGPVDSSPSVVNELVYAGSWDGNLYAMNASTGSTVWSFQTGGYVSSSPAVASGVVYFATYNSMFYAANARTGALLWSYPMFGSVYSSPAVVNGIVYVADGSGFVYALNASTGMLLWSYRTGGSVTSSPAVVNGVVYVGSDDNNVYAFNAGNGSILWTFATGFLVQSSPAVADGIVYVGSWDNNLYALNADTGALLWKYNGINVGVSPAVVNGVVYDDCASGDVCAFNANTGTLLWNFPAGGNVDSSPAVANGVVYVGSEDGNMYAFGLTGGAQAKILAEQEAASNPPDLRTLRPDFNLKVSEPVAAGDNAD